MIRRGRCGMQDGAKFRGMSPTYHRIPHVPHPGFFLTRYGVLCYVTYELPYVLLYSLILAEKSTFLY